MVPGTRSRAVETGSKLNAESSKSARVVMIVESVLMVWIVARRPMTEVRGRKSEIRDQRSEVGMCGKELLTSDL